MPSSPKTVDLLRKVASLKVSKGWTFKRLTLELNKHLPDDRQLQELDGKQQVERWLSPNRPTWVEPKGEIVLAFIEVINDSLVDEKPNRA